MIVVSSEEIISQKVLPYDLYDEKGTKILEAGEILTPGKILLVRNHEVLFRKEEKQEEEKKENFTRVTKKYTQDNYQNQEEIKKYGPLNKKAKIDFQSQIELKSGYVNAMNMFNQNDVMRA